MITTEDILNMNFYKKEKFTGSFRGMRYLIRKERRDDTDVFLVSVWPGPYSSEATEESAKIHAAFPFTPEGKQQAVDWMNEQWQSHREEWNLK